MDREAIAKYYANLLIIQYHNKPKAKAVIQLLTGMMADVSVLLEQIKNAYNIDTAVGKQLEVVAKYFGIEREFYGIDFESKYFDFQYTDPDIMEEREEDGLEDTSLPYQTNNSRGEGYYQTLRKRQNASYMLSDVELRTLIKLRIITLANEKITYSYLYEQMFRLFGFNIIPVVNSDMTITYYFDPTLSHVLKICEAYPEYLPAPAGVGVNVSTVIIDSKYFTFIALTVNGGTAYNRFQTGASYIGSVKVGTIKVTA